MESVPLKSTAYGASKAAVNYIVRKIHFENPGLIAFPISPGWVQTDMGNHGATSHGMEKAPITIDQSIAGMLDKVCVSRFNMVEYFQRTTDAGIACLFSTHSLLDLVIFNC
jgi:NAD(P)-dependent dehydrogenase (short-subunit alcohol dehydrogenase family)